MRVFEQHRRPRYLTRSYPRYCLKQEPVPAPTGCVTLVICRADYPDLTFGCLYQFCMADCGGCGVQLMDDFRRIYRLPHSDDGNKLGQAPGVLHRPSISDAV